jgi:hypothetical protein
MIHDGSRQKPRGRSLPALLLIHIHPKATKKSNQASKQLPPISNNALTISQGLCKLRLDTPDAIDPANVPFAAPAHCQDGSTNHGSSSLHHDTHRRPIRYCASIGTHITTCSIANLAILNQPTSSRTCTFANSSLTSQHLSKPLILKDTSRSSPSQPHQSRQKREISQTTSSPTRPRPWSSKARPVDLVELHQLRRTGLRRKRKRLLRRTRKLMHVYYMVDERCGRM